MKLREYESYEAYVAHQADKLDRHGVNFDWAYVDRLKDRLRASGAVEAGMRVLCLGARLGPEVRAFLDLGCFAVGVDVNPGPRNPYVVTGDFHALQYATGSVDVVFSNALDHVLDFPKLLHEAARVLAPGGRLLFEIVAGTEEGYRPGDYEAAVWPRVDDVLKVIIGQGWVVRTAVSIDKPWKGRFVWLERQRERA